MSEDRPIESRRELENLRQRYQEHRRTIRHLLQTAPDSKIAKNYEETLGDLQRAIDQLDRVDRQPPPSPKNEGPKEPREQPGAEEEPDAGLETIAARSRSSFDEEEFPSSARTWDDPLVRDETAESERREHSESSLSWVVGVIVIAAIAAGILFVWPDVVGPDDVPSPTGTAIAEEPVVEEAPPPASLTAEPAAYDYGIIHKGTRSVHRFRIDNQTDQSLPISVERSTCRCLWYDYPGEVPARGSVELAVTVDAARAETGVLSETITVRSRALADAVAEFDITAEIRER